MQKVGQMLKEGRKAKKFSLADVHKFIKIQPRFLKALEEGDHTVFSTKIHAKGFLKNYAQFLGLDEKILLGLWRREYEAFFDNKEKDKDSDFKAKSLEVPKFILTPGFVVSTVLGVLVFVFFGYLFYQYRSYTGAPRLNIYTPENNIVVQVDVLDVTGKTDLDSVFLINNQRVVLDKDGSFATSIKLKEGINTLSFLSINKLGKETEEIRTIIYREVIESTSSPNL